MGSYLHRKYDESGEKYETCYDEWTGEPCLIRVNKYVPRIKGTEMIAGITIGNLNYFPILTKRIENNKEKFYLFDFIKIKEKYCLYKGIEDEEENNFG